MTELDNTLEPIEPRTARELFLDHKKTHCTDATVRAHSYRTGAFIDWCDEQEIKNLNELTGRDLHQFRLWHKEQRDINQLTLHQHMSALRVFVKWAASIEAVADGLHEKMVIPTVDRSDQRSDAMLEADRAKVILDYLSKYHYASRRQAILALLWETGIRIGAANSIDLCDVSIDEGYIELIHRPESETTLKNGKSGERPIAISDSLAEILEEYIETNRLDKVDDFDRSPLITGRFGRLTRTTYRRIVYETTAPCFRGEPCPGCTDNPDTGCPESVSPHAIRRGSITHYLTKDVPVEVVSDRMNVSRDVLDKHYDKRSEEVKLEQRRGYLDKV